MTFLYMKHGVQVVLSGHEHVYERAKPQNGVYYFTVGSGGKLNKGNLTNTNFKAAGFDQDCAFLLLEVAGNQLYFQAVSRTGETVDSGMITRPGSGAKQESSAKKDGQLKVARFKPRSRRTHARPLVARSAPARVIPARF